MGHLSHTSDLERYYRRFALENERRWPLESGQYRCGGVEQLPLAEVAVRMRDDDRPRRPGDREDANQPSTVLELPVQSLRNDFGRSSEHDHVIGRTGFVAFGGSRC